MKLKDNWAEIAKRAWSVRFMALALLATSLETAFPYFHGWLPVPDNTFGFIAFGVTALAILARHVDQENLPNG